MKKSGFTLAEVLISIAIVGVAAALTLPTLSLNVEKKKIGSALMKAINTIESASTFAIQVNDVRKLSEIKSIEDSSVKVSNLLSDLLPKYTKLVPMPYFEETAYGTKDGVVYYKGAKEKDENENLFHIVVDTNGERGPNVIGRDMFDLYVKEDGIVLPKGSYAYKNEIGGSEPNWKTQCPDKEATNPAILDKSYCAGHIADNSGRISYAYESINK